MSPVAVNMPVTTSPKLMLDVSRRPSPWHEIAHNLSATAVPTNTTTLSKSPERERTPSPTPLSASQALREREALLPLTDSSVRRYHLVRPSPRPAPVPKLAAERDKEGHIEYKLKLIDPTPERFERLVTQMMWRLMQGHNEAIYEIGLAGASLILVYSAYC